MNAVPAIKTTTVNDQTVVELPGKPYVAVITEADPYDSPDLRGRRITVDRDVLIKDPKIATFETELESLGEDRYTRRGEDLYIDNLNELLNTRIQNVSLQLARDVLTTLLQAGDITCSRELAVDGLHWFDGDGVRGDRGVRAGAMIYIGHLQAAINITATAPTYQPSPAVNTAIAYYHRASAAQVGDPYADGIREGIRRTIMFMVAEESGRGYEWTRTWFDTTVGK